MDDKVIKLIDKHIIERRLKENKSIFEINNELNNRVYTLFNIVSYEFINIDAFMNCDVDRVNINKYAYYQDFIRHARKRIKDLRWMDDNKHKFADYDYVKLLRLIKFKEKLSNYEKG
jgi:hypothetical protein